MAAGKPCIARIQRRSLDLAVCCTVHPGIRDVMRVDWPYHAIPCHTFCDQRVPVYFNDGTVITQRYFRYRSCHYHSGFPSKCVLPVLLLLSSFSPSCVSDRPNSSLEHDDGAPVNHSAFFSLRLRSLWSYCILETGLDRPLPCPLFSPGSPRCNSTWSKQTANAQTFYSWSWRRISAQWMPDIHTPKGIIRTSGKLLSKSLSQCAIVSILDQAKSPGLRAHTTPHKQRGPDQPG